MVDYLETAQNYINTLDMSKPLSKESIDYLNSLIEKAEYPENNMIAMLLDNVVTEN